jgi:hypothetical protein
LAQEGLFEITQTIGLNVPNLLYPFIFVGLLFVLLPFTSVIPHFLAILVGVLRKLFFYIDSTGLLDSILLPSRALNALDTSDRLRFYTERHNFIMKPGELGLPIPGSFPATEYAIILI